MHGTNSLHNELLTNCVSVRADFLVLLMSLKEGWGFSQQEVR